MDRRKKGVGTKYRIIKIWFIVGVVVVLLPGCKSKLPTSEHKLLLRITEDDCPFESDFTIDVYDVFYDGSVEKYSYWDKYYYESEFRGEYYYDSNREKHYYAEDYFEGHSEKEYAQIDEKELQNLYHVLNAEFLKYDEGELPLESNGWNIKLYDTDENLIHEYLQGGDDIECIKEILDISYRGREFSTMP